MERTLIFLALCLAVLTGGCGAIADTGQAEEVVASLFESIKSRDFEKATTFYSPAFFEKTPKEEWLNDLKNINAKLGDLQSYKLVNWSVRKFVGAGGSGTYWQMQYEVTYSKHVANEMLMIFKPAAGGEVKILGHGINSPGFLRE